MLLYYLGEDPEREGLEETPARVARFWREFIEYDPGNLDATFESVSEADQMVVVRKISFYSMCEHHLLPIIGTAAVAYIPSERVLGLSKIPRVVAKHASRLQLQERIANGVANELVDLAGTKNVAVYLEADHLCTQMRGIRSPCAQMVTTVMLGDFRDEPETRAEFLSMIK